MINYFLTENEVKFKPTIEWMKKWYDKLNAELFNGKLQQCNFNIFTNGSGSNGNTLGFFILDGRNLKASRSTGRLYYIDEYGNKIPITYNNFTTYCVPTIKLNGNYSGTESAWINTLVHEMCHYYTYMNGYAPKQSHGIEFRQIAELVSIRSNGRILIQRLANAEEMSEFELDDYVKKKNNLRNERKISKMHFIINILNNSTIRLSSTSSDSLINEIVNVHRIKKDSRYIGLCSDNDLCHKLFSKGYKKNMRTYRYWDITSDKELLSLFINYKWKNLLGNDNTLESALGMSNSKSKPNLEEPKSNNIQDSLLNQFEVINDGNGYNIYDKKIKHKRFGSPVDFIEYNKNENTFYIRMKNNQLKGNPNDGWTKISQANENTKLSLKSIIKETIDEYISNETNDDSDLIDITPNMNLAKYSPLEINQ